VQSPITAVDIEGPADDFTASCRDLCDEQNRIEVAVAGGGVEIGQAGEVDGRVDVVAVAAELLLLTDLSGRELSNSMILLVWLSPWGHTSAVLGVWVSSQRWPRCRGEHDLRRR